MCRLMDPSLTNICLVSKWFSVTIPLSDTNLPSPVFGCSLYMKLSLNNHTISDPNLQKPKPDIMSSFEMVASFYFQSSFWMALFSCLTVWFSDCYYWTKFLKCFSCLRHYCGDSNTYWTPYYQNICPQPYYWMVTSLLKPNFRQTSF
jgi:hypothetical protein